MARLVQSDNIMEIPNYTKKRRYYVATSITHAFSSWDTFNDAKASLVRLRKYNPDGAKKVIGIYELIRTHKILHKIKFGRVIRSRERAGL